MYVNVSDSYVLQPSINCTTTTYSGLPEKKILFNDIFNATSGIIKINNSTDSAPASG